MPALDNEMESLSGLLIEEVFNALGFSKNGPARRIFGGIFKKASDRLSGIAVTADRMIAVDGFPNAAAWMMSNWCRKAGSSGEQDVPRTGPLLIVSNHAGTYDTFLIAAHAGRQDLNLISSDVPFLKNLPNACKHIFFLSDDTYDRMRAARAGMRHLKQGGALLLYGSGLIDPDPAVYPDASEWIEKWLPSIDLFLHSTPRIQLVLCIVSGVVSERWSRHPVTWLKRIDWQKRRLAEFGQVIYQLFFPGNLYLSPCVSFSKPINTDELKAASGGDRLLPSVIARGKALLSEHNLHFGGRTPAT